MDLWVRSQDKEELTKVVCVCLDGESSIIANFKKYYNGCNYTKIGTYKSKERALEVLDEIQGRITKNECLKTMLPMANNIRGYEEKFGELFKEMIYEMPKE